MLSPSEADTPASLPSHLPVPRHLHTRMSRIVIYGRLAAVLFVVWYHSSGALSMSQGIVPRSADTSIQAMRLYWWSDWRWFTVVIIGLGGYWIWVIDAVVYLGFGLLTEYIRRILVIFRRRNDEVIFRIVCFGYLFQIYAERISKTFFVGINISDV